MGLKKENFLTKKFAYFLIDWTQQNLKRFFFSSHSRREKEERREEEFLLLFFSPLVFSALEWQEGMNQFGVGL